MICAADNSLFFFEKLAKKQVRIYPDAADYGYKYSPAEEEDIRYHLKELRDTYKNTLKREGDNKNGWWTVKMFIDFERDEGYYSGVELTITCVWDAKRKVKFLTIDEERATRRTSGYKD